MKYETKEQQKKFYNSYAWKKIRKQVIERDNYECQQCKLEGKVFIDHGQMNKSGKRKKITLVVHHIEELKDNPKLALDMNNLVTVCVNCHNKEHGRYFQYATWQPKKNRFHEDERW